MKKKVVKPIEITVAYKHPKELVLERKTINVKNVIKSENVTVSY